MVSFSTDIVVYSQSLYAGISLNCNKLLKRNSVACADYNLDNILNYKVTIQISNK